MIDFDFAGILRAPLPAFALSFASSSVPRDHQSWTSSVQPHHCDNLYKTAKPHHPAPWLCVRVLYYIDDLFSLTWLSPFRFPTRCEESTERSAR